MSPDETNEFELIERLARLKPAAGSADPRIAFYNMGFAAASSRSTLIEKPANRETPALLRWVTSAAAVAACMMAAFLTGYSFRPIPAPVRSDMAAGDSRPSIRESSVGGIVRGVNDDIKDRLDLKASESPIELSYPRSRAEMLTAGLQDPWANRELNAYGISNLKGPDSSGIRDRTHEQKAFVSTLTRMDYLNWEDSQ